MKNAQALSKCCGAKVEINRKGICTSYWCMNCKSLCQPPVVLKGEGNALQQQVVPPSSFDVTNLTKESLSNVSGEKVNYGEMQKLLEELQEIEKIPIVPSYDLSGEELMLILSYIRTIEKEHKQMRELLLSFENNSMCTCDGDEESGPIGNCLVCECWKVLSSLTLR